MSHEDIIRAWKDEEYRNSLSEEQRADLPEPSAGMIELGDETMFSMTSPANVDQALNVKDSNPILSQEGSHLLSVTESTGSSSTLLSVIQVEAISHLRVVASWDGRKHRKASLTSYYNIPSGFVVISVHTVVHSSNNGSRAVSTVPGGLNIVSETELSEVYDSAINFAASINNNQLKANFEQKKSSHIREVRRYQSSHNIIEATVKAQTHGSFVDRKRGWEEISVFADLLFLGAPGKYDVAAALEAEYGIDIPGI